MRNPILPFGIICFVFIAAQWPASVWYSPLIPFLSEHLSKNQQTCLAEAQTGKVFEMEGFLADGSMNQEVLEKFTVLSAQTLDAKQVQTLQEILNDSITYNHTRALKQCFFLPTMGLSLEHGSTSMNVLFSFSCDLVRFYESGVYSQFHLNPRDARLETFFKEVVFMNPEEGQVEEYEPMIIPYTPVHQIKRQ